MGKTLEVLSEESPASVIEINAQRFVHALQPYDGQQIVVPYTGFPDPDGMSWGAGVKEWGRRNNIGVTLVTVYPITRDDNRAMAKILDMEIKHYQDDGVDFGQFAAYCLGDTQVLEPVLQPLIGDIPHALTMDHHRPGAGVDPNSDTVIIDTDAKSTATMLTEIFQKIGFYDQKQERDPVISTGLMYGIYSDTGSILKARHRDIAAFAFLADKNGGRGNLELVERIGTQGISPQEMDIMVRAHMQSHMKDNYVLANVGFVAEGIRNAIARAADFVLMRKNADTVFVYGIVEDEVDCSYRTIADNENPRESIRRVFPDVKITNEYGGSYFMGGFQFKLGTILGGLVKPHPEKVEEIVSMYMADQFFRSLGGRPEERGGQGQEAT